MTTEDAMKILDEIPRIVEVKAAIDVLEEGGRRGARYDLKAENKARNALAKRGKALMLAAEATLLFHGGYWSAQNMVRWEAICKALLIPSSCDHSYGATSKQLCNIVRAAMEMPE